MLSEFDMVKEAQENKTCLTAGLDFGTSNSSIASVKQGQVRFTPFQGKDTIPTAVFIRVDDKSGKLYFGQDAINHAYGISFDAQGRQVQGSRTAGRLLRSIKSLLGSSTIGEQIRIQDSSGYNHCYFFQEVIRQFICFLKETTENTLQQEISSVVMGRPVRFVEMMTRGMRWHNPS